MSERANELTLRPSAVEKIGFSAAPHSTAAGRIQDAKAHRRLKSHTSPGIMIGDRIGRSEIMVFCSFLWRFKFNIF